LKKFGDLQILFADVTHLVAGLSFETLLTSDVLKVPNLLSGYTESNSIHNSTVYFVLENVDKKKRFKIFSPRIKRYEM
jgi:hypothetical protein